MHSIDCVRVSVYVYLGKRVFCHRRLLGIFKQNITQIEINKMKQK